MVPLETSLQIFSGGCMSVIFITFWSRLCGLVTIWLQRYISFGRRTMKNIIRNLKQFIYEEKVRFLQFHMLALERRREIDVSVKNFKDCWRFLWLSPTTVDESFAIGHHHSFETSPIPIFWDTASKKNPSNMFRLTALWSGRTLSLPPSLFLFSLSLFLLPSLPSFFWNCFWRNYFHVQIKS